VLTKWEQGLVAVLEVVEVEAYVPPSASTQWFGRKLREDESIKWYFVAKAGYGYPFTLSLIEALLTLPNVRRISGFGKVSDIPSEPTFFRAFAEFAEIGLGEKVDEALVAKWLKPELVGHTSRDATAIEGREKPLRKEPRQKATPRKGEQRDTRGQTCLERHSGQSAEEEFQELPVLCDRGT